MTPLAAVLLAVSLSAAQPPETLKARAVGWDISYRPADAEAWSARVEAELDAALQAGAEVVLFPELFGWGLEPYAEGERKVEWLTRWFKERLLPRLAERLEGSDALVVLGSYPHQEPGWEHQFNRAPVWHRGAWRFVDKLDPTPDEKSEKPSTRPGSELPLFEFRGGKAAVVICYSIEMPELASRLKSAGVQLVLAPSATPDADGVGRVRRTASARAVELGAAVLVSSLTGRQGAWTNEGAPALYLPAQKALEGEVREKRSRASGFRTADFTLPWAALLSLRRQGEPAETRPFLDPAQPAEPR